MLVNTSPGIVFLSAVNYSPIFGMKKSMSNIKPTRFASHGHTVLLTPSENRDSKYLPEGCCTNQLTSNYGYPC